MQIVLLLSIIHIHAREPFVITVFSLPHIKFRENLLLLSKLQERERENDEGKKRGEVAVPQRKNMTNDIALDVKAVLFLERKGDYYYYFLLSLLLKIF